MRRQHVVRGLRPGEVTGAPLRASQSALNGVHAHGCEVCGRRYTDVCNTPLIDRRCQGCRGCAGGRPRWEASYDPDICCRTNSIPATKHVMETYKLGGEGRWWLCRTCSRTIPYDPSGDTHE